MILAILGWAKLIPLRDWIGAGALLALCVAYLFWAHHERAIGRAQDDAQVAAAQAETGGVRAQLVEAQSANHACSTTIAALQMANATCESGRLTDSAAQAKALAARGAAEAALTQQAAAARTKLQDLLDGRCKAWAQLPACGATP